MAGSIERDIVEQAKKMLGITETLSLPDLYDMLYKYRTNVHPDKFIEKNQKDEAEKRFKQIGEILEKLTIKIQHEKLNKKPSEVMQYERRYEELSYKYEITRLQVELDKAQSDIQIKDWKVKELEEKVKTLQETTHIEKIDELINIYKPEKNALYSAVALAVLLFLSTVFSRVESIAGIVKKYSPISSNWFNNILFIIFVILMTIVVYQFIQDYSIKRLSKKIGAYRIYNKFLAYLGCDNENKNFKDSDVTNFIEVDILQKSFYLRTIYTTLRLNNEIVLEKTKDIFIYTLLTKRLIKLSGAQRLERIYGIIDTKYYWTD